MRPLLALLPAVLLSTSAFAGEHTLQTAHGVGYQRAQASLEVGAGRYASDRTLKLAAADVALSYGVAEQLDVTARFGLTAGWELGVKRELRLAALPKFVFAADLRGGLHPSNSVPLFSANLGGIAQWSPLPTLHLLASPKLVLASGSGEDWVVRGRGEGEELRVVSNTSHLALIPAASVGFAVDLHPSLRLVTEAGFAFAPLASTLPDDRREPLTGHASVTRGFTGALAIQWRPADFVAAQ